MLESKNTHPLPLVTTWDDLCKGDELNNQLFTGTLDPGWRYEGAVVSSNEFARPLGYLVFTEIATGRQIPSDLELGAWVENNPAYKKLPGDESKDFIEKYKSWKVEIDIEVKKWLARNKK